MPDLSSLQSQYAFLAYEVFGNTVLEYVTAAVVFVVVFTILRLFKRRVIKNLTKLTEKTETDVDDLLAEIVQSVGRPFYWFVSLAVGVRFLTQPAWLKAFVFYIALAVVVYTAVRAVQQLIDYGFQRGVRKRLEEDPRFDASVVRLLSKLTKGLVWVVAILLALQNLGYNITALMAGLGIGGLAIAFALQSVLADIFASFSIYMDKPFRTGDFIIVDGFLGTVKHIGIKSTRIESLWGEEVVMPNKFLTEAKVKNYRKMKNRRETFTFGVTYDTPGEKLRKIPEIVKDIIAGIDKLSCDRVHFKSFGDSDLTFEVMFNVETADYNIYMDVRQEMNLALKERLEKEGIEFAYPTQTLFVYKK